MWNEPEPDPGGKSQEGSAPVATQELSDLKEQNEQQQLMIAQLKEMLRKEQSTVPQEKVEEYINTLSKVKAKKSRTKRDDTGTTERGSIIDSNKKEKLNLLKQQLEVNKAKLAERDKSQKGIEEMVTQIQAQLHDSQQLIGPTTGYETKSLVYSKNSAPEELYNILLIKERKITELVSKIQKQEATILDLQENLKEKDSVIDARTKAITLMTDSLSRKGKDTLDALDETKEQMRTMQENFVTLESEMKARQKVLLNDLKVKNLEIAELQELNQQLTQEKHEYLKHTDTDDSEKKDKVNYDVIIKELEDKLNNSNKQMEKYIERVAELEKMHGDTLYDLDRLKNTGVTVAPKENDGEVAKLRKQIEEYNKNMIKVKAQHKSKVKDLTRKLETFKKMNDANALIIELQNENTKLSEKIAELEEEKGNIQLKMVESTDSARDSAVKDDNQVQEEDLVRKTEIVEKDKIISSLENDIVSLKQEITILTEKIVGFSHLENMQVTSEINTIQFEEQIDKLTEVNSQLQGEIEDLIQQKEELQEKIETLVKEKNEVNLKLENYIQENMELIDKLEKLSAEKVSSAESIEIVEGLTHQEKLELAAYQKNIEEPIKCSQEDEILEAPPELNESVMQLTEDSAELLHRIEMFNLERKEVMSKMEDLKEENNRLSLKVTEIENNRDILAETYEQLQTEKEGLQERYEQLLEQQRSGDTNVPLKNTSDEDPTAGLLKLQKEYETLLSENEKLKIDVKNFDQVIQEKHNLEKELNSTKFKVEDLESKLKESIEEISNYQNIIDQNKNELINSSNIINDFERKLNERENDIKELNDLIIDLNTVVSNLQAENEKLGNFEIMETQVNDLKMALNKQIEETEDYNEELERSNETISSLHIQIEQMKEKILETEHEIELKDIQLKEVITQLKLKDNEISNLQMHMSEKEQKINSEIEDIKQKYLHLQRNLDGNNETVEKKIEELTIKNKEQLEKMKKIAANLKKKTQALQDLEERYHTDKEKWESEINEKGSLLSDRDNKIIELTNALEEMDHVKVDLQNMLVEARQKHEKMNEVSLKQELSTSLHEEFDNTVELDKNSANEDKIKELEMIIETNESELSHYKERNQHLEEYVMKLTEEKDILYRQGSELEQQLTDMTRYISEKTLLETQLTEKLQQVEICGDEISKRLTEVTEENREFSQKHKEQEELITKLKIKLKKAHERVTQLKGLQSSIEEVEKANDCLKKQLIELEVNQKHSHEDQEASKQQNRMELEKIEADYQAQMAEILDTKNSLTMDCEKLTENLKEYQEKEAELLSELNEYKQKIEEIEADDACQIQKLSDELKSTTDNWRVAISQIESLSQQLADVQKQIVFQSAQETVDNILSKAVKTVYERNSVETQTEICESFVSQGDVHTWQEPRREKCEPTFYAISASENMSQNEAVQQYVEETHAPKIESSREQLMEKIRALEFLLYNIDKEKDEVVKECTGMVNELTRLVYEKVSKSDGAEPSLPLELESQILTSADIVDATNNQALRDMEFIKCDPDLGQQNEPVLEEVIQSKQAYTTYQPTAVDAFEENDDGWGWGPEESRLEEEHIQRTESTSQVQALKTEIIQLKSRLQAIQVERDNYCQEIKLLQAKSGKLVKKCKELKLKNDQFLARQNVPKKTEGSDFFDLDATIQEELKSQISQLEKKIRELSTEFEKEKAEKAKLLKQCDVLVSANDRMVEMKEIQDAEVLHWKRKFEEIEVKLQSQDWNSDGFTEHSKSNAEIPERNENLEDLRKTIDELTIDNEELQALLDEQRQMRIDLEKSKSISKNEQFEEEISVLESQLSSMKTELQETVSEKQHAIDQLSRTVEERETLFMETLEKNKHLETALAAFQNNESDSQTEYKIQMESIVTEKDSFINNLKHAFDEVNATNEDLCAQVEKLNKDVNDLQLVYQELERENIRLQEELVRERQNKENLQVDLNQEQQNCIQSLETARSEFVEKENQYLVRISDIENQIVHKTLEYDEVQRNLEEKNNELTILQQKHEELEITSLQLQEDLARQQNLNEELKLSYTTRIDALERELSFNKQLGASQPSYESILGEKENSLKTLELALDEINKQKILLEEELQTIKKQLEKSQNDYAILESQTEETLEHAIQEMELKWQEQVDERGNTVADSWKYHLNMVETEFASIQERLKGEIQELETKCSALVNENNELRNNVDAEIRNEVDRLSAMQQQINEKQHSIHELQKELDAMKQYITEKDNTIASLKLVVDTTQQQLEEKREVVEEIVKILEENAPWPLSCEMSTVIAEFKRQLSFTSDRDQEITRLNARIVELQIQFNSSQEKEAEIFRLQQQITTLQEKETEIKRLENVESELQKMVFELQTREEQETTKLNNIIKDYKIQLNEKQTQLAQLNEERAATIQTIDDYKKHCEELGITYGQLQSAISGKDNEIQSLKQQLDQAEMSKNDNNKDIDKLQEQIAKQKEELNDMHQTLSNCQSQVCLLTQELTNKTNDLQNINQEKNYYLENINRLEQELAEKANQLQILTQQINDHGENSKRLQQELDEMHKLVSIKDHDFKTMKQSYSKELANNYEETLSAKEIDLQTLRSQLNEAVAMIEQYSLQLNNEIHTKAELELVIKDLEQKLSEQSTLLEEEHKQLAEMRLILEDQVVKIEELNKELFQKSNDYDSLIAEMDIGRNTVTQQPKSGDVQPTSFTSQTEQARAYQEDDLSEPVSRAELDLALYMLHQRDVRCEELTVELTQLLEERDTLQLRLSNAIREKEDIRRRLTGNVSDTTLVSTASPQDTSISQSKSSAIFLAASGTELATEPSETLTTEKDLASKLSELKSVGYKKDKTFVDEQEIRRLQQISIMQQHIQEASKLPPEAAAKLVDASYTLSRDVQSPSKVLLNWLWGRSTPKVNDT